MSSKAQTEESGRPSDAEGKTPHHDANGKWKKGNRANPGGLKKGWVVGRDTMRRQAQELSSEAIGVLRYVMLNKRYKPDARVRAANSILDRAWGKPTQPLSNPDGGPVVSADQVLATLDLMCSRAKGDVDGEEG